MPWSDLSEVTVALTRLLERNIDQVLSPGLSVSVVATPPDQLGTSVSNTLSLYLYHVRETAEAQNRPGPGSDLPNVATAPMGLDLFYVLTAHQRADHAFDAIVEQRLMGYAMKTFHDVSIVTDATMIAGAPVLTGTQRGRNNRLNIELRKLEPDMSFAIWTTGERQFTRLAAYYQVGLVLLEPEPALRMPGTVLSVGAFVTPMGTVTLTGSRSGMAFALPAISGGGTQTLQAEPARPAVTAPAGTNAEFSILGENLSGGLWRRLTLRNARWARLTPPLDRVPLDPALNLANGWVVDVLADRINVRVGSQLTFAPPGGGPNRTIQVFPGTYAVRLDTVRAEQVVGGQVRSQSSTSNEIAFPITPRIVGHALNVVPNTIRVDLDPAFPLDIAPPLGDELDIQVIINGHVYRRNIGGPLVAGEFAAQPNAVLIFADFSVAATGLHSLRLSIEAADAQPYWIEIP
jgi:Pvc16 N-terminal domain